MDNAYYVFKDAVKAAEGIVGKGLLEDGSGRIWDCNNLSDVDDSKPEGGDGYWCVGWDGSIGYTEDNGYNVRWDYIPANKDED